MQFLGSKIIEDFKKVQPQSRNALKIWQDTSKSANWQNIEEVRRQFKSVDYLPFREQYCFEIKGNKFRLIASINFSEGSITVHEILTHSKYDRWNKKR